MKNFGVSFSLLCLFLVPLAADAALFGDDKESCIVTAGIAYETAFSDSGQMALLVVKNIASAKKSIRVAARHFNSKAVAIALVQAVHNGRELKVVLDKRLNNNDSSAASFLRAMSMPPHVVNNYDNVYQDYIVIDEKDIILGNVAGLPDADAERKNPSSVLVIHNAPKLARQYLANWKMLWDSSEEMQKAKGGGLHDPL